MRCKLILTSKTLPVCKFPLIIITNCYITVRAQELNNVQLTKTRMWANAQPDGRPAEHRWHPLFNAQSLADGHYLTAAPQRCQDAEAVEI